MTDIRTRIAAAIQSIRIQRAGDAGEMADAVIRELDGEFLDLALWLSEELTGEPMSRIDAESCLKDWKASR